MGLIKAAFDAARQSIGDQFKEFVTCPEVTNDVIIQRGIVSHGSGNSTYSEGVISNGSGIVIPQGMAMMIVDNGKVVEFSADPGTFVFDTSSEPSVFTGGLGKGIVDTIKTIGSRITYGGSPAKDQRVYYINIKNLPAIPFGSQQPEIIKDPVYGSVEVTYNGDFNVKVDDPVILVNTMLGTNPSDTLTFNDIFCSRETGSNILKARFAEKVSATITDLMVETGIPFNEIGAKKPEISAKMNTVLNEDWYQKYGIIVTDVAIRINASEESKEQIREIDKVRGMAIAEAERVGKMSEAYGKDPQAAMAAAAGESMLNASKNENGAMGGFVGMGFAQNAGSNLVGAVSNMEPRTETTDQTVGTTQAASFCSNCGAKVTGGNFCTNCGAKLN